MWELLRNIAMLVAACYTLSKVGPPAVDIYFLPTIKYVAGTFHAVAPHPAPATTFTHLQTPIPAENSPTVLKTIFFPQTVYETMSMPEAATITGIHHGQWPFNIHQNASESSSQKMHHDSYSQHDGSFYGFSPIFETVYRIIYQAGHYVLLTLRQLIDNTYFDMIMLTASVVSWKLLKQRNEMNMESLKALHELELVRNQQETSALTSVKDLEVSLLTTENKSQRDQLQTQRTLLDEAREEARRANEAKTSAEKQSNANIAKLNASITEKDDIIATRDDILAEVTKRAESAEKAKKTLEDKARKNQSDFDSALQRKQNEIDAQKCAADQAADDRDGARRELRDAKAQAGKDKKRITELELQVTDFTKKTTGLDAQVKENNASISRKEQTITSMRDERQKLVKNAENLTVERDRALKDEIDTSAKHEKLMGELQTQVTEANNLRKVAEAKASNQAALAAEATEQRVVAERRATQQETRAAEAEETCKAAEEKASQEQANAADAAERVTSRDERIATLKAESETSYRYVQRCLDSSNAVNADLRVSLNQAKADARDAEVEAKRTQETLQERIVELEEHVSSANPAPSSSQEPSILSQPLPVVRLPGSDVGRAGSKCTIGPPVPRWDPPPKGKTKTPPEERGLPANTPTGPKAGRQGRQN